MQEHEGEEDILSSAVCKFYNLNNKLNNNILHINYIYSTSDLIYHHNNIRSFINNIILKSCSRRQRERQEVGENIPIFGHISKFAHIVFPRFAANTTNTAPLPNFYQSFTFAFIVLSSLGLIGGPIENQFSTLQRAFAGLDREMIKIMKPVSIPADRVARGDASTWTVFDCREINDLTCIYPFGSLN